MHRILKSMVLGLGLAVGAGIAAQAQSVSSLPPGGANAQSAVTQPYGSTQSYFPKPGGSEALRRQPSAEPSAQAPTASQDPNFAPYSVKSFGPKPN